MEIRYTLTLEDYAEGNRLLQLNTSFRRKLNYYLFVRFGYWVGITLFCVGVAGFLFNLFSPTYRMGAAVAGITAAVAWVGAMGIICPITYRRKIRRFFRDQKLPSERTLQAQDSGVFIARTDGTGESRLSWSALDKAVESEGAFVLIPNVRSFIPVPKRAMTAGQLEGFRALVAAHVPGAQAAQRAAVS